MVDNFAEIRKHLKFESNEDFYFLQIMQRKKDGNQDVIESTNNGYRVIKSYYIKSLEEWDGRESKIKSLCKDNNARCYININRRNNRECCWEAVNKYMELLKNDHTHQGYTVWDHACGASKSIDKMWMIDIDTKDTKFKKDIKYVIKQCRSKYDDPFVFEVPSKNGFHLVTQGFDLQQFYQLLALNELDDVDVHKQGIILLYFDDEH